MREKVLITSTFYLAIATLGAVLFPGCKAAQPSGNDLPAQNKSIAEASPTVAPKSDEIPQTEIKSAAVSQIEFNTVYKDFYDADSKCHKDYVEYFGKEDGAMGLSSPCAVSLTFKRDGGDAAKTIAVRRWDKAARETKEVERTVWTAKISPEQFARLVKTVTEDEGFKSWRDGTMINVSNASVSVVYPKGRRSMQMNLVEETVNRVLLFGEFKRLDKEIKWEKAQ